MVLWFSTGRRRLSAAQKVLVNQDFPGNAGTKRPPERQLRRPFYVCLHFVKPLLRRSEEEGLDLSVQHHQQSQRRDISDAEAVELVHGELVAALLHLVLDKFRTKLMQKMLMLIGKGGEGKSRISK